MPIDHLKLRNGGGSGNNNNNNNNNNKYLETIPGKHSIDSLQKAAVLGTSHIIRKVLQSET
jgi:hypothetical protein